MAISDNHIYFFISYATSFLVMALIGKWYLYPAVKKLPLNVALTPLLLYACLRVNGLTFLMPGIVGGDLPQDFALPTAFGDLTAVILALLALWTLRNDSTFLSVDSYVSMRSMTLSLELVLENEFWIVFEPAFVAVRRLSLRSTDL